MFGHSLHIESPDVVWIFQGAPESPTTEPLPRRSPNDGPMMDRDKTVTKLRLLRLLRLLLSEKQIPQVVENLENGDESKEALERAVMRPRQVRYQAALRPDIYCSFDSKPLRQFPILSCLPNRSPKNFDPGKTVTKPHQLGLSVSKPWPSSFASTS